MLKGFPVVDVIGAPQDLGQTKRGVDMGPSAIRVAGLIPRLEGLGFQVNDKGDAGFADMATSDPGDPKLRFVDEVVKDVEALANVVEASVREGHFPLVLGGDHSVAIGTVGGLARVEPRQALIWVDAHPDINTAETTPSGNIHGMPVAAILGYGDDRLVNAAGVSPKALETHTVFIALRDVDPGEAERLKASDATVFTMRHIDQLSIAEVVARTLEVVTAGGVEQVHLSFDMDAIDPRHAPGTGTPVPGGLNYREAHLFMELLYDADVVTSAEMVEVNPALDERNRTAEVAVELVASLAGKRIMG